jgi:predicted transcriptional regulator of viral defense system
MHPDTNVDQIAAAQGGVVTRAQAIQGGLTPSQIHNRVRGGRWIRITNGTYRVFAMDGSLNLVRAAVASLPMAVASHFSASALHEICGVDTSAVSVMVHSQTTHDFPGVKVFRCHDLSTRHIITIGGLPTTTVARTVVDLASLLRPRHLESIVDDAVAARRTTMTEIREVLESVARRGKPGVRSMRAILNDRLGESHSPTVLERAGMNLLTEAGLTEFATEFSIPWSPHRRFDVAFPKHKLAIEWDSRRWHLQAEAFDRDRARDREAIMRGWRVLRFTWDDVHRRQEAVIETIQATLSDS